VTVFTWSMIHNNGARPTVYWYRAFDDSCNTLPDHTATTFTHIFISESRDFPKWSCINGTYTDTGPPWRNWSNVGWHEQAHEQRPRTILNPIAPIGQSNHVVTIYDILFADRHRVATTFWTIAPQCTWLTKANFRARKS